MTATRNRARSIPGLLAERAALSPDSEAFRYRPAAAGPGWESMSWAQAQTRVREMAAGLIDLGVAAESRVAILSGTRVEWILADLAILAAGAATTTIYPSNTAEECAFVIADSQARIVIVEDAAQLRKLRQVREAIPSVSHVAVIGSEELTDADRAENWVLTLDQILDRGRGHPACDPGAYDERIATLSSDRLATLIYTSGTTGAPKGVELTHGNWVYEAYAVRDLDLMRPADLQFLFLPMAHSFGKVLEVAAIASGTATAIDGSVERVADNLAELRPTVVAAPPRVFEKIHNTITATVTREGGLRLALFRWARRVGLSVSRAGQGGPPVSLLTRVAHAVADRLVFTKVRARFGGRIRLFVSGSAPLSVEVAEFFDAAGLIILEGYGLTESSAASFVNRAGTHRFGTVGPPLPGTEVRIAADGEILIRGPGVMRGYHGLAADTRASLVDGWLYTGDIGELDPQGRLRITDRKKELIKTSGGKYVAPALLEGKIKAACPYLGNVVVHGDRRNYCVALVTLDPDVATPWAQRNGLPTDLARLAEHPKMREQVTAAVDAVNAELPSYSTVKDVAVLGEVFTVEAGQLTPSMKVRRKNVEARYAEVLDGLYAPAAQRT